MKTYYVRTPPEKKEQAFGGNPRRSRTLLFFVRGLRVAFSAPAFNVHECALPAIPAAGEVLGPPPQGTGRAASLLHVARAREATLVEAS